MNDDSMDPRERLLRGRVKDDFRKRMKALRGSLPKEARAARSAKITERLLALPELASVRSFAAFSPIRGEVDPRAIVRGLREREVEIILPRVLPEEGMLSLHRFAPGDPLTESGWGILEPPEHCPRVTEVDAIMVPALAVDLLGHRIGYGKGFYDRLLPTLGAALRITVAYDFQLIAEVPALAHDERVDLVVTDAQVVRTGRVETN